MKWDMFMSFFNQGTESPRGESCIVLIKKKPCVNLLANCTKFMPQRILQIQPTMIMNVTICKKPARIFRRNAFIRFSIFVGHPQKTVNAEMMVPANRKEFQINSINS